MRNIKSNLKSVGENIKEIRLKKQLTIVEVANKLRLDTTNVTLIESGQVDISVNTVLDIADVLEVKPTELFDFAIG